MQNRPFKANKNRENALKAELPYKKFKIISSTEGL